MKVLLVGNYINDGQESMSRYCHMLAEALGHAGIETRVVAPRPFFGRLKNSPVGTGKWLGYCDKFGIFPGHLRRHIPWADVVHICDQGNAFYVRHVAKRSCLVTCHDLFGVRSAIGDLAGRTTAWTGRQLQKMILRGLQRSTHVAAVSGATRADLLRISGIPASRISVVHSGLNYPYSPMTRAAAVMRLKGLRIEPDTPYVLHVGGNQWYKNRIGALRIFERMRQKPTGRKFHLIMAGKAWTPEMRAFVQEHQLERVVVERTSVPEEDLRALYSCAQLLLFPSIAEGFGWPIIEAQACGCPVVTTNRAPMTEIGGDAAVYVDADDVNFAADQALDAVLRGSELRCRGLLNVKRFTVDAMTKSYCQIYRALLQ